MKVNIKKLHPDAVVPKYAKDGDAGLDLVATDITVIDKEMLVYSTGLAVEIPKGFVGLLFPRSSIRKYDYSVANCVGVIDSGYRGEISVTMRPHRRWTSAAQLERFEPLILQPYKVGDRVAQLIIMPYPQIELIEVSELSESQRGEGGYGSTGK